MKKLKPYWKMTVAELREATKEFDDPGYQPPAVTSSTAELAQQRRAKAKGGQPGRSPGSKTVSFTLENGLLADSDSYARQLGISRAELIRRGLLAVLPARRERARKRAG